MPEIIKTGFLNSSLKAYYRFESGALTTDSSGNGLTLTNANTVAETASGKFGGGADAGSTNTNKYFYNSNNAGIAGNGDISMGGWFYINTLPTSGNTHYYLEHYSTTGADRYLQFYLVNSSGTQRVVLNASNTSSAIDKTLSTNAWHHIVITRNVAGNIARLFIDNEQITTCALGTNTGSTNLIRIGGAGTNLCVQGIYDDVFYYGAVLSTNSIKSIYEGRYLGELNSESNVQGLWHLNGNATDASQNYNHGSSSNVTYGGDYGKFSQGGSFNGSSSKITITDSSTLKPTGAFTIFAWIKLGANNSTVFSSYTNDTGSNYRGIIVVVDNTGKVEFFIGEGGTNYNSCKTSNSLSTNVWYNVVATWDTSNMKVYVNGSLAAGPTAQTDLPAYNATNLVRIGCFSSSGSDINFFNGSIDEVALFNAAKDAAWIKKQYALSVGKYL